MLVHQVRLLFYICSTTVVTAFIHSACRKSKITKVTPQSVESSSRDKTAPTLTSDVITTADLSHSRATISWSKGTDETSPQANLYYKVVGSTSDNINTVDDAETMESGRFMVRDWTKDMVTTTAYNLVSQATYYFNVLVADEAGNRKIYNRAKYTVAGWKHEAYIKSANNTNSDNFGGSLAISGETLVVGALNEDSNTTSIINGTDLSATNNTGSDTGAAYVYKRSGSTWVMEAYLKAPNPTNSDSLGNAVSIDADTIVVGSYNEDSNTTSIINGNNLSTANDSGNNNGAAYVFKRSGTTWALEAYLKAPNSDNGDVFGANSSGVAVSGDTIAVGAVDERSTTTTIINGSDLSSTNNGAASVGAVYVFRRSGATWSHEAYLKAPNGGVNDQLGSCVSISADTILTSTIGEDSSTTTIINGSDLSSTNNLGGAAGAAYIFKRSSGGTTWSHEAYLKAPNAAGNDYFGESCGISGDTIVIGALLEDSNTSTVIHGSDLSSSNNLGSDIGAAYVFKRTGTTWAHEAYLKPPNPTDNDSFSYVAISGDMIAVGAINEDSTTTDIINGADLSAANNSGLNRGAVYVFERSGSTWTHRAYLKAPNGANSDLFGNFVAASGDTVVVSSAAENSSTTSIIHGADLSAANNSGTANGAVYVFR